MKTRLVKVYEVNAECSSESYEFKSLKEARAKFKELIKLHTEQNQTNITICKCYYEVPAFRDVDTSIDELQSGEVVDEFDTYKEEEMVMNEKTMKKEELERHIQSSFRFNKEEFFYESKKLEEVMTRIAKVVRENEKLEYTKDDLEAFDKWLRSLVLESQVSFGNERNEGDYEIMETLSQLRRKIHHILGSAEWQ